MKRKIFLSFILVLSLLLMGTSCAGARKAQEPPTAGTGTDKNTQESAMQTTSEETTEETTAEAIPVFVPEEKGAQTRLANMTPREKVGQLFIVTPEALSADGVTSVSPALQSAIDEYRPGGFIFFSKNIISPTQLKAFTSDLKNAMKIKPFLSVDEEGGSVARIGNAGFGVKRYASMASVGETGKTLAAFSAGQTIGAYLLDYGFDLDYAPVADVNSNPNNPVIGRRAFGKDPYLVADMAGAFIDGLHSVGVMSSLKHFPGHGDTVGDTHEGFVSLDKDWEELKKTELIPFIQNLEKTDTVMIAHVALKKVTGSDIPASLSYEIVTEKLRNELGFEGLILTDSLQMGAITKSYSSAEAAVLALEAGVDLLLMPENFPAAFEAVLDAVEEGRLSQERINESVLRILEAKGY